MQTKANNAKFVYHNISDIISWVAIKLEYIYEHTFNS